MGRASFSLGSSQIPRGAEVLGSASKTPFPKGVLSPLPPCPLRHYGALAVQQGAVLAWWQKGKGWGEMTKIGNVQCTIQCQQV